MILITGGLGFIGMHVARELAGADDVALTFHRSRRGQDEVEKFIGRPATLVHVDVDNPYSMADAVAQCKPSGIVHLAVPGLGAMAPAQEIQTNVSGLVNVMETARVAGVSRVTIASSVAVYGGVGASPFSENDPLPVTSPNPTSAMKKAIEVLALYHADRTDLDLTLLRIGMIYGPLYHSLANLPGRLLHHAVKGRPLSTPGARWTASQMRTGLDLCYVKDCAAAVAMIHQAPTVAHRVYNVGAGRATSPAEVVAAVREVAPGLTLPDEPGEADAGRSHDSCMSVERIKEEFGYAPQFSISEGIRDYARWLRDNDF